MKKLKNILAVLSISSESEVEIASLALSSDEVEPGALFIALKGEHRDGADYLAEAVKRGAVAAVADREVSGAWYVPKLAERLEVLGRYFYDYRERLNLYGVTGTTGKSTLAYLLANCLNGLGEKTLLLTTTPGLADSLECELTTPDPIRLYRAFHYAEERGYRSVVLECSSIGIALGRVRKLFFKALFITNITSDHLDFHKTKRRYRRTKLDYCLSHTNHLFVTDRLPYLRFYRGDYPLIHRIETRKTRAEYTAAATFFSFGGLEYSTQLLLPMNLENVLLALKALIVLGYDSQRLRRVLAAIPPLKGRVERVDHRDIYIDYAHTAAAVETLLAQFRRTFKRELIAVIGAGGNRDRRKRKDYRRSLKKYADFAILTSDNPRDEDPLAILKELVGSEDFTVVPDRRSAIKAAVRLHQSRPGSILLIIGKGPEEYQLVKGRKLPFSDREEVLACLTE